MLWSCRKWHRNTDTETHILYAKLWLTDSLTDWMTERYSYRSRAHLKIKTTVGWYINKSIFIWCLIDLKPGCKLEFKKNDHFGPWRDPAGPFFIKGPLKLASHGPLWSPLGGPGRSRRFPRALAEFLDDQKINLTWLEGLQSLKCRNSKHSLTKDLSKLKVRNISSDTCPTLTKL